MISAQSITFSVDDIGYLDSNVYRGRADRNPGNVIRFLFKTSNRE